MIRIEPEAWEAMLAHAEAVYPNECCGAMLGRIGGEVKSVERALPIDNAYGAYFSETDLKNSCPWYSFIVLSIRGGRFDNARSWLPNPEQTEAESEELSHPEKTLWQKS